MLNMLPSNSEHFQKLLLFAKRVFSLFEENSIDYVIYGSFALFYYTKDTSLAVNDVDVMVHDVDREKIISLLEESDISFEASKDELFIKDGDLLIEVDGWGLGEENLSSSLEKNIVSIFDLSVPLISLKNIEHIYSIARAYPHNTDAKKIEEKIAHLESFLGRPIS